MTELTSSPSHELSQPLTAISYSALAVNRLIQSDRMGPGQVMGIINDMIRDNKRTTGNIGNILNLLKPEAREKE